MDVIKQVCSQFGFLCRLPCHPTQYPLLQDPMSTPVSYLATDFLLYTPRPLTISPLKLQQDIFYFSTSTFTDKTRSQQGSSWTGDPSVVLPCLTETEIGRKAIGSRQISWEERGRNHDVQKNDRCRRTTWFLGVCVGGRGEGSFVVHDLETRDESKGQNLT